MDYDSRQDSGGSPLGSLLGAVIEALGASVVVFDRHGQVAYASESARPAVEATSQGPDLGTGLAAELLRRGGRRVPLQLGESSVGEAVFLGAAREQTLADRERRAIIETLQLTGGRLAEAARHLGISRTTLWRRLKAYGVRREAR